MGVAAAALVAVVALGYYGYRQNALVEAPSPAAASSTSAEEAGRPASGAAVPAEPPLANREPAETEPEEPRRPNAAAGVIARPRPAAAAKAAGQPSARKEVCTAAVAALGLCTMTQEDRRLAESVADLKEAVAKPQAAEPGTARAQDVVRPEACTEALAALGLCTPAPKAKGE
jgi:hypothetical protein